MKLCSCGFYFAETNDFLGLLLGTQENVDVNISGTYDGIEQEQPGITVANMY